MPAFDESFDFVVVGSGGGSMCAGLFMRARGRDVVILEKTDKVGGTTATAGGVMWIPNNRFMAQDGVEDSPAKAMTYLDAVVGEQPDAPGATRARRSAYVAEAPRMVDFLVGQGVKLRRVPYWPDYYDELPGGSEAGRTVVAELYDASRLGDWADRLRGSFMPVAVNLEEGFDLPTFRYSWKGRRVLAKMILRNLAARITGKRWVTAGGALQGRMLEAALKTGVDIRLETPVAELIVEDDRVVGVVVEVDGVRRRIGARLGVLLNAGGFARNQQMRDLHIPGTSAKWTNASPGDTGEMILEGQRIGAAVAQMSARVGSQMAFPPTNATPFNPMVQMDLAKPHAILVDQSGVRYMNEGGSYSAFCKGQLLRHQTVPAIPSWMVFDSQYIDRYMLTGSLPGAGKPKQWLDSGYLRKAPTIAGLAAAIGVPADALAATVDRYNGFARAGRDADFGRGDRAYDRFLGDKYARHATIGSIEKGPFYAIQVFPGDVGTYGGLVTDADARVLREDGSVIEGLYATGVSTASVMGHSYPGAGSSIGPSFTWGYVAAKHAAGADNHADA